MNVPEFWRSERGIGKAAVLGTVVALAIVLLAALSHLEKVKLFPWISPWGEYEILTWYTCSDCQIVHSKWPGGGIYPDVYVDVPGVTTPPTQLTTNPNYDTQPVWSPDGSRIAFGSDRDSPGDSDIFVMDADGGNQTNLTNHPSFNGAPAWSPDGSKIAFESNREGSGGSIKTRDIFVMDADGGNVTQLTTGDYDWERWPAWSPDGTKIAYSRLPQVGSPDGRDFDIWVMDADGGNKTPLTINQVTDFYPDWSPDGSKIVFSSIRDDIDSEGNYTNHEIYVMLADGGNPTRLTFDSGKDTHPDWSPDGTKIAWTRVTGNQVNRIWEMNADGSDPRYAHMSGEWPDWRPASTSGSSSVLPPPTTAPPSTTVSPPTVATTAEASTTTTVVVDATPPPPTTEAACTPEAPVLLRPPDQSPVIETMPLLEWAYRGTQPCVISAQRVDVAVDDEFAGEVVSAEIGPEVTSWMPESGLEDCTVYFWRVAAADSGPVSFSETWSFDTDFLKRAGSAVCP